MESIPIEILEDKNLQKNYVFDYIKDNNYVIENRDILVLLQDLGYIWEWNENKQTISKIRKGIFSNISVLNIEDVEEETMDIETKDTHSYISNGLISHNTVNLPKEATVEDVSEVFIQAYKRNIIGVTVYRDGCREGVLVHESSQTNRSNIEIVYHDAPKRPKNLMGKIHHVRVQGEDWIAFVGMFKERPYEIFAGKADDINLSRKVQQGMIEKVKKSYYFYPDGFEDRISITKDFMNDTQSALTRQISLNLRHGTSPAFIIDQLEKSQGSIVELSKCLSRVLKKYITTDDISGKIKCSQCGSTNLEHSGGCYLCLDCRNDKCGG